MTFHAKICTKLSSKWSKYSKLCVVGIQIRKYILKSTFVYRKDFKIRNSKILANYTAKVKGVRESPTGILSNNMKFPSRTVCNSTSYSDRSIDHTLYKFYDLHTELGLRRITSGFHGAIATDVACQLGTLTLPDTLFRPFLWLAYASMVKAHFWYFLDFTIKLCPLRFDREWAYLFV